MSVLWPVQLAHQGGWDEILLVLLPVAIFAGLLALANQRAARDQAERDAGGGGGGGHGAEPDRADRDRPG